MDCSLPGSSTHGILQTRILACQWASLVAQRLKHLPGMWETWVQSLGREDPLEKEMATHSSTLAWRIPWREESGRLQSMGSQRVGHDWATYLTLPYLIPISAIIRVRFCFILPCFIFVSFYHVVIKYELWVRNGHTSLLSTILLELALRSTCILRSSWKSVLWTSEESFPLKSALHRCKLL